MKRKGCLLIITVFLMIMVGHSSSFNIYRVSSAVPIKNQPHLGSLGPADFSWNAFIYERYDFTSPTYDDSIEYSVDETMIYLHELDTFDCVSTVYTIVPVTNDHLVISGELRAKADYSDAKNAAVVVSDPITFTRENMNIPVILYFKDDSLDSGFQYFGVDYYLPGYTEALLEFRLDDGWSVDYDQTLWVKNFQVHTDGELPLRSQVSIIPDLTIYDWSFGTFTRDSFSSPSPPLTPIIGGDFEHSVNSTHAYVGELGSGTNEAFVGAYITVPVIDEQLAISFNAYATCDANYLTSMQIRFFNPETKDRILRTLEIIHSNKINNTIENQYIEFNVTIPGLDEVIVFFFYEDGSHWGSSGNDNHKLWISELNVFTIDYDYPSILCENELFYEEGSTGNYISWRLIDDNPDMYYIYEENILQRYDKWTNNETISYNVDFLAIGTHNFTLKAYNQLGNFNLRTISVIVTKLTEIVSFSRTVLVLTTILSISIIYQQKRRRR